MFCLYNSEAAATAIVSAGPSQISIAALDADVDAVAGAAAAAIVSAGPSQTNFNWAASDSIAAFDAFVDANLAATAAVAPTCVLDLLPEHGAASQVQYLGAVAEPISSLDAATKPLRSAPIATNQCGGGGGGGGGGRRGAGWSWYRGGGGGGMTREEAEREMRNILRSGVMQVRVV